MAAVRCCILGATGFIGGQIARAALARGWEVRALRRGSGSVGALQDVAERIDWVQGDLSDPASLVTAMRGCLVVFHAAGYYPTLARNPWTAIRHGVSGMRNVLAAAGVANVRRMVYTSALTTVGTPSEPGRIANESDFYLPGTVRTTYFEVKYMMELEAMRAAVGGLPVIVTLPTVVIGPGDVKPTTSRLLLLVARRKLNFYVDGNVNVVDGRDVATGHLLAAERGRPGARYLLGGHNVSIKEMLTTMAESAGVKPPRRKLALRTVETLARAAGWLGFPDTGHMEAIRHWQALDTDRARQELGLPGARPFDQTCRDTLEWFVASGKLKSYPAKKVTVTPPPGGKA